MLEELSSVYPTLAFIRFGNGPEFIAQALRDCCETSDISTEYIETGFSWENGFAESFNRRFRDEVLNTSCSPQLPRLNSWLIAGAGSTKRSGLIRASRGVCRWRQLNQKLQHDYDHRLS